MRFIVPSQEEMAGLSGHLIAAHPHVRQGRFAKTVVLICGRNASGGSIGIILNKPLGIALDQIDGDFAYDAMGSVALYQGGPTRSRQLILTAWQWTADHQSFKLYFGVDQEAARNLVIMHPDLQMRGYLGYVLWRTGELEQELVRNCWVVGADQESVLYELQGDALWQSVLQHEDPNWKLPNLYRAEDVDSN